VTGTSLIANGNVAINGGSITTVNDQVYNNAVTLGAVATLTSQSGDIYFNGATVDGGNHAFTLSNAGTNSVIASVLQNVGSFTKSGSGILTLSNANTYTGNTIVSAGTLVVANSLGLGASASIIVNPLATLSLNVNGGVTINKPLSLGGTLESLQNDTWNGNVTLTSASTLNASNILTMNGTINGNYALTLAGNGTVVLGNNVGNNAALASLIDNLSTLTLGNNVTLTANNITLNNNVSGAAYNLVLNAPITLGSDVTLTANNITLGNISGAYNLVLNTPITLGSNATWISNNVTLNNNVSGGAYNLVLNTPVTLSNNVTLTANNITLNNNVSGAYNFVLNAPVTLSNDVTLTANNITLNNNVSGASYNLVLNAPVTLGSSVTLTANNITFNNSATGVGYNFVLNGAVTVAATTLTASSITFNNAVSGTSLAVNGLAFINGGSIHTTDTQSYSNNITLGAATSLISDNSDINISASSVNGANYALTISNAGTSSTISSLLQNLASFTKNGSGTLVLSNTANTYTGQTIINGGILQVAKLAIVGSPSSLGMPTGASANILLGNATLLDTGSLDTTNREIILIGNGTVAANGQLTLSNTLDPAGNSLILGGTGTIILSPIFTFASNPFAITSNVGSNLTIDIGNITTPDSQLYNGNVALGTNLIVTSGNDISFNGGLIGNANTLTLVGNTGNDHIFTLGGSVIFNGGSTNNITLVGDANAASNTLILNTTNPTITWTVSDINGGTVMTSDSRYGINFTNIQNLVGGTTKNTFVITDSGNIQYVNGGSGIYNTLDYLSYLSGSVFVDMSTYSATNVAGFNNIQIFNGSQQNKSLNTFMGGSASGQFNITNTDTGYFTYNGVTYSFTNFPNLSGGSVGNVFVLTVGGFASTIQGASLPTNNINSAVQFPDKSNMIIFGSDVKSGCFSSGIAGGCINDPIHFSQFNTFISTSGTDQVLFSSSLSSKALVDRSAGTAVVDGMVISFNNFDTYGATTFLGYFQNVVGAGQAGALNTVSTQASGTSSSSITVTNSSDNSDGSDSSSSDSGSSTDSPSTLIKKAIGASSIDKSMGGIQEQQNQVTSQTAKETIVRTTCP